MSLRKPYITRAHVIVEIVSLAMILLSLVFCIYELRGFEGQIPTHYNFKGEVDGYGSPMTLMVMPLIMLGCNLIVSVCLHLLPKRMWNMPVKVKSENSNQVYMDCAWMMVLIELEIAVFAAVFTVATCLMASSSIILAVTVIWTVALLATIAIIWVKMVRDNRR